MLDCTSLDQKHHHHHCCYWKWFSRWQGELWHVVQLCSGSAQVVRGRSLWVINLWRARQENHDEGQEWQQFQLQRRLLLDHFFGQVAEKCLKRGQMRFFAWLKTFARLDDYDGNMGYVYKETFAMYFISLFLIFFTEKIPFLNLIHFTKLLSILLCSKSMN